MKTRNIAVTLEQAREWYNSGNETLKTLALNAYSELEEDWDHIYHATDKNNALTDCAKIDSMRFKVLHQLSIIAAYFNKDWKMQSGKVGYLIGERYTPSKDKMRSIEVFSHTSVMYAGIIYFKRKEDIEKAIKILGEEKIKKLFE